MELPMVNLDTIDTMALTPKLDSMQTINSNQTFFLNTMFKIIYILLVVKVNSSLALHISWTRQTFIPAAIQSESTQDLIVWRWLSFQVQVQPTYLQGDRKTNWMLCIHQLVTGLLAHTPPQLNDPNYEPYQLSSSQQPSCLGVLQILWKQCWTAGWCDT